MKEGLAELHREESKVDEDKDKKLTLEEAQTAAKRIKKRFPVFSAIKVVDAGTRWDYEYAASPGKTEKSKLGQEEEDAKKRPIRTIESISKYKANFAEAKPLTAINSGNESTVDVPDWEEHAQKLNAIFGVDPTGAVGRRGPWVKGHKIHHELNGDGQNPDNIFIIDKTANDAMSREAEKDAIAQLNNLIKLTDSTDPNYNKVMFYSVRFDMWGSERPLSAFAEEIRISYGTVDPDDTNKEEEIGSAIVDSSKPPESLDAITIDLNGMGENNINTFLRPKGVVPSFARFLAFVLRQRRFNTVSALARALQNEENIALYNEKPPTISDKLVEEQTDTIENIINPDMTFSLE